MEDKFDVEIRRDPTTGEVTDVTKRPTDEVDEMLFKVLDKKNSRKREALEEKRKKRRQEKKEKLKLKKQEKLEKRRDDFEHLKDTVKFGEIVHRPPVLTAIPKKASEDQGNKVCAEDLVSLLPLLLLSLVSHPFYHLFISVSLSPFYFLVSFFIYPLSLLFPFFLPVHPFFSSLQGVPKIMV